MGLVKIVLSTQDLAGICCKKQEFVALNILSEFSNKQQRVRFVSERVKLALNE